LPCAVAIDRPHSGQTAGATTAVEGTATLAPGHHLWIFARRVDFAPRWWLQGEATVNLTTHQWRSYATLGEDRDAGWKFDLAAAVFGEDQHQQLAHISANEKETGHYLPHEMPRIACAASTVTVTRN
jgi:hypothetical protein